jgi:hypothetical protein
MGHAICEDYRAGATIDCAQDTEDQRALLSLVSGTRMLERGEWLGHLVCGG